MGLLDVRGVEDLKVVGPMGYPIVFQGDNQFIRMIQGYQTVHQD